MALPNIFMQLVFEGTPLPGDAAVEGYKGQIVLDSLSWDVSATHKPMPDDKVKTEWRAESIKASKVFDRASTTLYSNMKARQNFDKALITVVDTTLVNGVPIKMMELEVKNGFVESISTKASDAGSVMSIGESISLSFDEGTLRYYPSADTGRGEATTFPMPKMRSGS